jgi:hypothetical protein
MKEEKGTGVCGGTTCQYKNEALLTKENEATKKNGHEHSKTKKPGDRVCE